MAEKRSTQPTAKATDAAETAVQDAVDAETEKGYRGSVADSTPNHAYTVAGQLAGEPVPEVAADPAAARQAAASE